MRPLLSTALLVLALAPLRAEAQLSASGRAALLAGADTNAPRDYDTSLAGADATASLVLDGSARYEHGPWRLFGDASVGGRKFVQYSTQDVLVSSGAAEVEVTPVEGASLSLLGSAKDRRGGQRDYTDGAAQVALTWLPDARLQVRLRGGVRGFQYRPNENYDYSALEGGGTVSWRFDARHRLVASLDMGTRDYLSLSRDTQGVTLPSYPLRKDGTLAAAAAYEYRGPIRARLEYGYSEQRSNSFGETSLRHRLAGQLGVKLPWEVTAVVGGALQLTRFPDGIFLSSDILLAQDEENANSVTLRLARPLTPSVDVELRCALYQYKLPLNQLAYLRQVAFAGVSVRVGD